MSTRKGTCRAGGMSDVITFYQKVFHWRAQYFSLRNKLSGRPSHCREDERAIYETAVLCTLSTTASRVTTELTLYVTVIAADP